MIKQTAHMPLMLLIEASQNDLVVEKTKNETKIVKFLYEPISTKFSRKLYMMIKWH